MKNKSGIILSDVLIAITVFLIMSLSIFVLVSSERNLLQNRKEMLEKSKIIKIVKNELIYNTSYYSLEQYVDKDTFIDIDKISMNQIKECSDITTLFKETGDKSCIKLKINEVYDEKLLINFINIEYEVLMSKGNLSGKWIKG